jgi:CRP-like cAMP-binding protein
MEDVYSNAKVNLPASAEPQRFRIQSDLFAGLGEISVSRIIGKARVKHFPANASVITRGTKPDHLFLLVRGRARSYMVTEDGAEILLLWVVPGVALGLVSLLPNPPAYMVDATTVSECEFLTWDQNTVQGLVRLCPQLAENGFRVALKYLAAYMKRHVCLITKSAESRLSNRLVELARDAGVVSPSGISIAITNEQLSSLSDISLFTASRLLSKWEQEGRLHKHRGKVTLLDPQSFVTR